VQAQKRVVADHDRDFAQIDPRGQGSSSELSRQLDVQIVVGILAQVLERAGEAALRDPERAISRVGSALRRREHLREVGIARIGPRELPRLQDGRAQIRRSAVTRR